MYIHPTSGVVAVAGVLKLLRAVSPYVLAGDGSLKVMNLIFWTELCFSTEGMADTGEDLTADLSVLLGVAGDAGMALPFCVACLRLVRRLGEQGQRKHK